MSRLTLALFAHRAGRGVRQEARTFATGRSAPAVVKPKVKVLNADSLVIDGMHYRLANGFAPQAVPSDAQMLPRPQAVAAGAGDPRGRRPGREGRRRSR